MSAVAAIAGTALALSALAATPPSDPRDDLVGSALSALTRPPGDPLDHALDGQRSLLSFLPDDVVSGRWSFRLRPRYDPRPAPRWSGVFWRTADGNAYTRSEPYDVALVRRAVRPLAERLERQRLEWEADAGSEDEPEMDPERFAPLLTGEFYDGAEYQITLDDVLLPYLGVPGAGMRSVMADDPCPDAIDRHYEAVRDAVARLEPAFEPGQDGRDTWRLDLAALHLATDATRDEAAEACNANGESMGPSRRRAGSAVLITRWARGVQLVIDNKGEPAFRDRTPTIIDVLPGDAGPPPSAPRPATGPPMLHDFLRAVAACRALPWEYSNFAAGDSYTSPEDVDDYLGPNVFTHEWVCERDVPDDKRQMQLKELARA